MSEEKGNGNILDEIFNGPKTNDLRQWTESVKDLKGYLSRYRAVVDKEKPKYMITFPYPYMNGRLHLGHAFTMSKADFMASFMRHEGYNVMFPFAFHATGTPIAACIEKLKREIEEFGCPPRFPEDLNVDNEESNDTGSDGIVDGIGNMKKKIWDKTGGEKRQWKLLEQMLDDDEKNTEKIKSFTDFKEWVTYFIIKTSNDLTDYHLRIDWFRSFTTTNLDQLYNEFVKWQFNRMNEKGVIKKGVRYSIYSPQMKQVCADHDRSIGEGVKPVKMNLVRFRANMDLLEKENLYIILPVSEEISMVDKVVFRPDFGQLTYVIETGNNYYYLPLEVLQNLTAQYSKTECDKEFIENKGKNWLFEIGIERFLGEYDEVIEKFYEETIRIDVACLYIGNQEINVVYNYKIPSYCKIQGKTSKELEKINDFDKIIMIDATEMSTIDYYQPESPVISRVGDKCVVGLFEQIFIDYDIKEYKDVALDHLNNIMGIENEQTRQILREKLENLKEWPCTRSFGFGTKMNECGSLEGFCDDKWVIDSLSDSTIYMYMYMFVAKYKGLYNRNLNGLVPDSSPILAHYEFNPISRIIPTEMPKYYGKPVILRSIWSDIQRFECIDSLKRRNFMFSPISKISDVIDFDDLDMKNEKQIFFWLMGKNTYGYKDVQEEIAYWNNCDLRVTGKDLLSNHIPMSLMTHAIMFDEGVNLGSVYANGHLCINGEKMSKSKGNFITLRQMMDRVPTDIIKMALALAGDGLDDASLEIKEVNAFVENMHCEIRHMREHLEYINSGSDCERGGMSISELLTSGWKSLENAHLIFFLRIHNSINEFKQMCYAMKFSEAFKLGIFEMRNARNDYLKICGYKGYECNHGLMKYYIYSQIILFEIFCPEISQYMWKTLYLGIDGIMGDVATEYSHVADVPTPNIIKEVVDLYYHFDYVREQYSNVRRRFDPKKQRVMKVICRTVLTDLQKKALKIYDGIFKRRECKNGDELFKNVMAELKNDELIKRQLRYIAPFIGFYHKYPEKRDILVTIGLEKAIFKRFSDYLYLQMSNVMFGVVSNATEFMKMRIEVMDSNDNTPNSVMVGLPNISFS